MNKSQNNNMMSDLIEDNNLAMKNNEMIAVQKHGKDQMVTPHTNQNVTGPLSILKLL
jgi:hypothetical protein